jgi:hypothetical protein
MGDWTGEWMNGLEWMNESKWMVEWASELMNDIVRVKEWVNGWANGSEW